MLFMNAFEVRDASGKLIAVNFSVKCSGLFSAGRWAQRRDYSRMELW